MSEIQKLDALKAHAERAADHGLDPSDEMEMYEPAIRCIWFTEYCKRLTENEKKEIA